MVVRADRSQMQATLDDPTHQLHQSASNLSKFSLTEIKNEAVFVKYTGQRCR
jgi:hypothetical protein